MDVAALDQRSQPVAAFPRPPWHGRGQGFESPKLHGGSASQSILILKMHNCFYATEGHLWS
jgi:hypothetical protein